jgi:hypothetical protein
MSDKGDFALLPGEHVIRSSAANWVIERQEYGLRPMAGDRGMTVIGMAGKEAVGGHLTLTNFRLVFVSHALNRVTGQLSILLPTVTGVADTSKLIVKRITVRATTFQQTFVIWGIPAWIAAIDQARTALGPSEAAELAGLLAADPNALGDAVARSPAMVAFFDGAGLVPDLVQSIADPSILATMASVFEVWRIADDYRNDRREQR